MPHVATVSFKVGPEQYTVLRALAEGEGVSLSEFLRATVEQALELDDRVRALRSFVVQMAQA